MEPIVNGLEEQLADTLIVLRVDVQSPAGREISMLYGSRTTPTFIFLDPQGEELWRSLGILEAARVRESIE